MPWCKIVEIEGKQILFTNTLSNNKYVVRMSIQAHDFGGKQDILCLDVEKSDKPILFTVFLCLANETTAARLISKYITPHLARLQS